MRYAIISDIHANATALNAVLDEIHNEDVDRIVCLGDIVGVHTAPGECIDQIVANNILCIAGNHDAGVAGRLGSRFFPRECWQAIEWTRAQLTPDHIGFLRHLPGQMVIENRAWAMHGSFDNSRRYVVGGTMVTCAALRLNWRGFRLAFFGYTHQAACYRLRDSVVPWPCDDLDTTVPLTLPAEKIHLVNPGSIGQSRTGDTRAAFAIFNDGDRQIAWRRVAYDYGAVIRQTLAVFPEHEHLYTRVQEPPRAAYA